MIGAGTELTIQPEVFRFKRQVDSPYTKTEAILNVLAAGVGGGLLRGTGSATIDAAQLLKGKLAQKQFRAQASEILERELDMTPREAERIVDEAIRQDRSKPQDLDVRSDSDPEFLRLVEVERAAKAAEREADEAFQNAAEEFDAAGGRIDADHPTATALDAARAARTKATQDIDDFVDTRHSEAADRAARQVEEGDLADTEDLVPAEQLVPGRRFPKAEGDLEQFTPDQLQVDAMRFQFKSGTDAEGVVTTAETTSAATFDRRLSGKVLVYEDLDGGLFIVDGHQRLGIARRAVAGRPGSGRRGPGRGTGCAQPTASVSRKHG